MLQKNYTFAGVLQKKYTFAGVLQKNYTFAGEALYVYGWQILSDFTFAGEVLYVCWRFTFACATRLHPAGKPTAWMYRSEGVKDKTPTI